MRGWYSKPKKQKKLRLKTPFDPKAKNKSNIYWRAEKYYEFDQKACRQLASDQDYRCAICNKPDDDIDLRIAAIDQLVIDHDHVTGKVRGLLCRSCNYGLGIFKDNPRLLANAAAYIKNPPAK